MTAASNVAQSRAQRLALLPELLGSRILILDGAMGTMIQRHRLDEAGYRGERFAAFGRDLKGNNDLLTLTQPGIIRDIHAAYLEAGADIVETNTFNSTSVSQADYGLESAVHELNYEGARLARAAADEVERKTGTPRFVAGVLGPTNRTASISPDVNRAGFRNVTFDELVAAYLDATHGLVEGGADMLLIETVFDTLNCKAAIFAVEEYFERHRLRLPLMISGTITDASGRTLSGQTPEAFWNSIGHAQPLSVGLNCALGAEQLRQYVEEVARVAGVPVSVHPNAGAAERLRRLRRHARVHGRRHPRVGRVRISQHRRRLLRHHAGAHQGDCRCRRPRAPARIAGDRAGLPARGSGATQHRSRFVVRERRRAH